MWPKHFIRATGHNLLWHTQSTSKHTYNIGRVGYCLLVALLSHTPFAICQNVPFSFGNSDYLLFDCGLFMDVHFGKGILMLSRPLVWPVKLQCNLARKYDTMKITGATYLNGGNGV